MNTTLTIHLTGQLTLNRKSLEQFIYTVTPTPITTDPPKLQTSESSFLNEKQLLGRFSISRRTLFNWRMRGKIPSVTIGRRVLYHWPSVESALLRRQRGLVD